MSNLNITRNIFLEKEMDPQFFRQEVDYHGPHGVGTIVIDTPNKLLYLVEGNGRAMRYGIGVGRPIGVDIVVAGRVFHRRGERPAGQELGAPRGEEEREVGR